MRNLKDLLSEYVERGDFSSIAKLYADYHGEKEEWVYNALMKLADKQLESDDVALLTQTYMRLKPIIRGYAFAEGSSGKLQAVTVLIGAKILFLFRKEIEEYFYADRPLLEKILNVAPNDEFLMNRLMDITAKVMFKRAANKAEKSKNSTSDE